MIKIVYKNGSSLPIKLDSQVASDYLLSTIECDKDKIEMITETQPQTTTTSPRKSKIMFIKVTQTTNTKLPPEFRKESKHLINLDHVVGINEIIDHDSIDKGKRTEIMTIQGSLEVKEFIEDILMQIKSLGRG